MGFEGRRSVFAQHRGGHLSLAEGYRMDLKRIIRNARFSASLFAFSKFSCRILYRTCRKTLSWLPCKGIAASPPGSKMLARPSRLT